MPKILLGMLAGGRDRVQSQSATRRHGAGWLPGAAIAGSLRQSEEKSWGWAGGAVDRGLRAGGCGLGNALESDHGSVWRGQGRRAMSRGRSGRATNMPGARRCCKRNARTQQPSACCRRGRAHGGFVKSLFARRWPKAGRAHALRSAGGGMACGVWSQGECVVCLLTNANSARRVFQ